MQIFQRSLGIDYVGCVEISLKELHVSYNLFKLLKKYSTSEGNACLKTVGHRRERSNSMQITTKTKASTGSHVPATTGGKNEPQFLLSSYSAY